MIDQIVLPAETVRVLASRSIEDVREQSEKGNFYNARRTRQRVIKALEQLDSEKRGEFVSIEALTACEIVAFGGHKDKESSRHANVGRKFLEHYGVWGDE